MNSFFDFEVTGEVVKAVNNNSSTSIWNSINKNFDSADGNIAAPFLSNHDNGKGRVAGQVGREADKIKFAYGLLSMFSGNTFTYYGDEIGMTAVNPQSDPDLRIGMLWDDIENVTTPPFGASEKSEYLFGSVKSQQKTKALYSVTTSSATTRATRSLRLCAEFPKKLITTTEKFLL